MNEQIIDSTISQLGNTIAQLSIDLAVARATSEDLLKKVQELEAELEAPVEEKYEQN